MLQSVVRIILLTKCDMQNSDHGFVVPIPWDFMQRIEQYRLVYLVRFFLSFVLHSSQHKRKKKKKGKNYTSIL